ncbi:MAG TPA: ABC transporter substrate-binding protein [Kofleriaceae bacterium]|nr:ABC transporter substrate-binding protein [Kofleriaceae bacterium]
MHPRHYANTVALPVILVFAAIGCEPRTRRTPDDTVVVLVDTPFTTGDPRAQLTNYDNKLVRILAPGLTAVDTRSMEPRLELASRIDAIDDLTIDVTVRADARFSDGSPVTAADVAGTYMSVLAPDSTSASHKTLTDRFTSVEAIAPSVARFHLKAPLATFRSDLDFGIVSFHGGAPPLGRAIGAGPYRLRELTSTDAYLEVNPYYYGPAPRLPKIDLKLVRDTAARLLMLVGGSADLSQNAVRLDLVAQITGRPRVHVEHSPGVILTYLMMNNADPVLADRRVRRAIELALDRPAIIAAKLGGLAVPATGLLPPMHWAYNGDVPRWDHDLAAARRLLDEAGLRDPDGDGPAPRLRLVYKTSADAFRVAIARVIAAQLAEVGIAVEVRSFEFATFFADVKKGAYQLASMQTAEITEPDFYFMYFHSSWIPTADNPDGFNRWRYRSAPVDQLTLAGRQELDRERRKQIYAEVQRIVAEDVPIIPLWHEDNVVLTNRDVEGYQITPNARLIGLRDVTKRR